MGPRDASRWIGSGAGVAELAVVGGLFVGGNVPVVPAGGVEVGGEFGFDIDDARVGTPWTAEADGVVGGCSALCAGSGGVHRWGVVGDAACDFTIEDDVAGGLVG